MKKKIGIIAIFTVSEGGGGPKVTTDLINAVDSLGFEVYLFTSRRVDRERLNELYGKVNVKNIYQPGKIKHNFCRQAILSRKLLKKEFKRFAKKMDMIIDIDGGLFHENLPIGFKKSRYIVWRISSRSKIPLKWQSWKNKQLRERARQFVRNSLKLNYRDNKNYLNDKFKIYAVDKWTKKEMKDYRGLIVEKKLLYPAVNIEDIQKELKQKSKKKRKNQIVILGRFEPDKMIEGSIKIFEKGTKNHPNYKLIIIGGMTPLSKNYLKDLIDLTKKLNIKNKVKIIKDPSFDTIKKVLLDSKVLIDFQKGTSITLTSIEGLAAGCIILAHNDTAAYRDILERGKYGFGFEDVTEGGMKLDMILRKLEKNKLNNKKFLKKARYFSQKEFKERVRRILNEEGMF